MQILTQVLDVKGVKNTLRSFSQPLPQTQTFPIPAENLEGPPPSSWTLSPGKRVFDFFVALVCLTVLGLPMLAIALCVLLSSTGPALFVQDRVGLGGRLFAIFKFRSMTAGSSNGPGHTRRGDLRITAFGRWMRKLKLDELPQFYNVLRGDMSLIGPRPKLSDHEHIPNMPYRPGITGAATLAFRHEEHLLSAIHASDLDCFYDQQIKPLKAQLDLQYMSQATFWSDFRLMAATVLSCLMPTRVPQPLRRAEQQMGAVQ